MATQGEVEIDFGAWPGTSDTSIAVTGQAAIAAGAYVEAWVRPKVTAEHSIMDHIVDPPRVIAADVVPGAGFTIYGFTENLHRHYGKFNVAWVWNN